MTSREIIRELLAKRLPERMGLNEHFWGKLPEMGWDKQGVPAGTDYVSRFGLDIRSAA